MYKAWRLQCSLELVYINFGLLQMRLQVKFGIGTLVVVFRSYSLGGLIRGGITGATARFSGS